MVAHVQPITFPVSAEIRALLWMQGLMNTSHFMTIPLLALYMSTALHFNAVAVASVMSANLLSAQTLPLFAGAVADRFGSRHVMVIGLCLRGLGFLGFSVTGDLSCWIGFALLAGSGVACYQAGVYGILGRQPKASHAAMFAANNQMLNMGTAVGPIIGGLGSLVDARFAFAASAFLFGLLGIIVFRLKIETPAQSLRQPILSNLRSAAMNRNLWRLMLAASPWFMLFPQLYVAFPLYAGRLAGPHAASAVYVVNGVVGLSFMYLAKRWLIRTNPVLSVRYAYLAAAIVFASVSANAGIVWFLLFIASYTVIETIMLPSLETITASLDNNGNESTLFGMLSAVSALAGTAGYYLGSWLILNASAFATWTIFGIIGIIGFAASHLTAGYPPSIAPPLCRKRVR